MNRRIRQFIILNIPMIKINSTEELYISFQIPSYFSIKDSVTEPKELGETHVNNSDISYYSDISFPRTFIGENEDYYLE